MLLNNRRTYFAYMLHWSSFTFKYGKACEKIYIFGNGMRVSCRVETFNSLVLKTPGNARALL